MYKIVNKSKVVRIADNKVIAPCDSVDSEDYLDYLNWIKEDNLPIEEEEPILQVWEVLTEVFLHKFTELEIFDILERKKTDNQLEYAIIELTSRPTVQNSNPLTLALMDLLVQKGIIDENRKNEILS